MEFSIVIPVKDEEDCIGPLIDEIAKVMNGIGEDWEMIIVDDGSRDSTAKVVTKRKNSISQIRLLSLTQNCGQTTALAAGFAACEGKWTMTLDGDGQNDPGSIPKLLPYRDEADLICGWRKKREDIWWKRHLSRIANEIRGRVCQDHMHDTNCALKLMRTSILKELKLFKGMHRFLPALFKLEGHRIMEVPVTHRPRSMGKSKYNIFNRGPAIVIDMWAVAWMRRRRIRYHVRESHDF